MSSSKKHWLGMGHKGSKHKDDQNVGYEIVIQPTGGKREGMATWNREGVDVTDVYEIVSILGSGLMGEVYKVRRKKEDRGVHNKQTRDGAEEHAKISANPPTPKKEKKKKGILKFLGGGAKKEEIVDTGMDLIPEPITKNPPSPSSAKPAGILRAQSYGSMDKLVADSKNDEDDDASVNSDHSSNSGHRRKSTAAAAARRKIRFKREYACKTLSTARVKAGQLEELMNEVCVLRTLDHPFVQRLYEVYSVKRKVWLVTELCTGGDLTSRKLNEAKTTVVLEQILQAVTYIHRRGVLHRNLKLENILYENGSQSARIRLIDFGLSKTFDRGVQGRKAISTAYTLSPEIASENGTYTEKTEIWSIGVMSWILLAGDFPFLREEEDLKDKEKLDLLVRAKIKFGITWRGRNISERGKEFARRCLKLRVEDRWTAKEALEYVQTEWIPYLEEVAGHNHDDESKRDLAHTSVINTRTIGSQMSTAGIAVDSIESFCQAGLLKKTILTTMAHSMDRDDVAHLREIFLTADTELTGTITLLELKSAFSKLNVDVDDATTERMFSGIDQDGSGHVHYAEFLAALAESQGLVTMERLAEAFDRIDSTGKGYISHDDLKAVLGADYNKGLVDKMIKEADTKDDGQVDYDEFLQLMFGEDPSLGHDTAGNVVVTLKNHPNFQDIAKNISPVTSPKTDDKIDDSSQKW
eukprot:CAMPEP_0194421088 /NCGR_PEP_ID=MMETSP0176-20130528/20337_1 /TAXON_ID=216777 /ORGANISM="Proboscia alata, Strain PI-D3" /LENGTH=695 /DNA_ID=CAMNT_0039229031 /DNA_START=87 /DNA_END=2171 /DNA_ORIENTATION=+